jgi:hypothetical protein
MHMVCHQTVRINFALKLLLPFLEIFKIISIIPIMSKYDAPVMPALNDMMRIIR